MKFITLAILFFLLEMTNGCTQPRQAKEACILYEQIFMLFILTLFPTYVYFHKITNLIKAPTFQEKERNNITK